VTTLHYTITERNTDEEILWLNVAVYNVQRVKIAECKTEVVDHAARVFLTVLARLSDCVEQIAALRYRQHHHHHHHHHHHIHIYR